MLIKTAPTASKETTESIIKNVDCNYKVNINHELQGIEIEFASKPEQKIITGLKELKFRWHRTKKIWYRKNDVTILNQLKTVL